MPPWLIPILKAVLPHVGTIISATTPVFTKFTKKSADAVPNQTILQQQITELQAAASKNDAHIKELAEQIKNTLIALEDGASNAERRHQRLLLLCITATVLSVTSLCTALYILLSR